MRAVVAEDGTVEETNDYYPYGMQMPGADGEMQRKQPYKFGGKEHLSAGGLNLYDFGPRALYAPAGQFASADPKCEDYPHLSPYLYCAANPVNLIDPTGMIINDPELLLPEMESELNKRLSSVGDIPFGTEEEKKELINGYKKIQIEISVLKKSDQVYELRSGNFSAGFVETTNGDQIYVILFDKTLALFVHEVKHAFQYENGELSFGPDGKSIGTLTDIYDEVDAYNAQRMIENSIFFFSKPEAIDDNDGLPLKFDAEDVYKKGKSQTPVLYNEYPKEIKNKSITKDIVGIYRK